MPKAGTPVVHTSTPREPCQVDGDGWRTLNNPEPQGDVYPRLLSVHCIKYIYIYVNKQNYTVINVYIYNCIYINNSIYKKVK